MVKIWHIKVERIERQMNGLFPTKNVFAHFAQPWSSQSRVCFTGYGVIVNVLIPAVIFYIGVLVSLLEVGVVVTVVVKCNRWCSGMFSKWCCRVSSNCHNGGLACHLVTQYKVNFIA